MSDYKRLPAGDYGTSKVPGLEIIKYLAPGSNKDGSVRYSWLVKALMPSRQTTEMIEKAKQNGGANNPYLDEPDFDGTQFLSFNARPEWFTPALFAVAAGRESLYLASKKVDAAQIEAATNFILEQATATASALTSGEDLSARIDEDAEKLKQQIQINVGTLLRLQKWAGKPDDEQADPATLVGTQFSGSVTEREYNGKTFTDVKVRPQGKK